MKKSLSILLSFALVFGLFASMASAADTELTVAQKYQALVDKGVLKGNPDGDARLDANLNRAEFATIAIAISGLAPEKPATATFSDVNSKQWWYGAIEAAAKAGLVEGYNGKFDPKANVTVEQVIKVAVQAAGLEIDEKAEAVEGASTWAAPYIKAALDAGLIATGLDYKADATRGQTILVGYSVYEKLNEVIPAKASITSAKATGVKKVTVELNKALDDTKATLSLKKGTLAVGTSTKWADDKKSAVLELTDVVIGEGEYTVTLGGLDAADLDVTTAKFTGEKEQVKSIEFVNTNDTLARSNKNIVKIKASNQYGENAAANAGSYTVYAGLNNDVFVKLTKDAVTGELLLTLDTTIKETNGNDRYQAGSGVIAVNIFNNDSHVSATKNFKMGTPPYVTKLEISPVQYSNGKDYLGAKGENAIINVNQFDQYGNIMPYDSARDDTGLRFVLNGYEPNLKSTIGDSNNDDIPDIKLSLLNNVDKSVKFPFQVNNQAGTASGEISLQSSKTANKVEFGDIDGNVAAGDAKAYLPVVAYDANGDQLSVNDLVNAQNSGRITFSVSTGTYQFVTFGENKGKLEIGAIPTSPRSVISVTAIIATANASSVAPKLIQVQDARVPSTIKVASGDETKKKIVEDGVSEFKYVILDQYGKELGEFKNIASDGSITATAAAAGNDVTSYHVVVSETHTANLVVKDRDTSATVTGSVYYQGAAVANYNKGFKFETTSALNNDNATFAVEVVKTKYSGSTAVTTEVAKLSRKIESTDDTLTYSVGAVTDLFNAIDSRSVRSNLFVSADDQRDVEKSAFVKSISLSATDAAGNSVAIPNTITLASSNNPVVAIAIADGGKAKVLGNSKGTTSVAISYTTSKGAVERKTVTVNTKDDLLVASKISAGNGNKTITATTDNAFEAMNLKVTDNYGVAYEGTVAKEYNYLFGVTFSVSNVKLADGVTEGGTVKIDQNGDITVTGGAKYFELTAYTADGSASTYVTVN